MTLKDAQSYFIIFINMKKLSAVVDKAYKVILRHFSKRSILSNLLF